MNVAVVLVNDEGLASEPFRVNVLLVAPAEVQEALNEVPVIFVNTTLVGVVGAVNVVSAVKGAEEVKPLEFTAVTITEYDVTGWSPPRVTVGAVPLTGVAGAPFTL